MKHVIIATLALVMATGAAVPACYANGTTIYKNTAPSDKAWNDAWGSAWRSSKAKAQTDEDEALAICRDSLLNRDAMFAFAGNYEVVVSDSMRHWSLSITSKGEGKGAAVCAKM